MNKIKRSLKLYMTYFKINFKSVQIYDKDFYFGIIAMILQYATNLILLVFIFEIVDEINGWNIYEILFLYGFNLIGYSLWTCFFINTISLPYYLKDGSFDSFLLKPVDPLFQVMASGFDEDSWGELVFGVLLLGIAAFHLKVKLWMFLLMPIFFISSCFIYAGISILFSTISFFTVARGDFANIAMDLKDFAQYPMTIYGNKLKTIFLTILPIGFASYYPSTLFLHRSQDWFLVLLVPVLAYLYFQFAKWVWYLGLRKYSSTGS